MIERASSLGGAGGFIVLVLVVFLFVLAVLWMLMPFLIMGTNKRLDKLIQQNRDLHRHYSASVDYAEKKPEKLASAFSRDSDERPRAAAGNYLGN